MAAAAGKGARGKATTLHSLIVRERVDYVCQNCGRERHAPGTTKAERKAANTGQMQCAHLVSRNYGHTRTDERNAYCLCAKCHWYFGKWPLEFYKFVDEQGDLELYEELKAKAENGRGVKLDWPAELLRLEDVHRSGLPS